MNWSKLSIVLIVLLVMVMSCKPERKKPKTLSEVRAYEKPLEDVNRYLLKQDEATIRNHCERRGWKMEMKASGLWYGKLKESSGDSVRTGDVVLLKYKVSLIDGTVLYDSKDLGNKEFTVGYSDEESGLEEGILMMRKNEKYRFIMPPHKAHGLLGDLKKIPARSIIIYEVELIDIMS
jgi:FKBP-type peptidyl-prolyl cis-trans isomerase